jgi:hypothetical protein
MRKGAAAVAVTQGPDAGHVCLQLIVNDDVTALVGRSPARSRTRSLVFKYVPPLEEHGTSGGPFPATTWKSLWNGLNKGSAGCETTGSCSDALQSYRFFW